MPEQKTEAVQTTGQLLHTQQTRSVFSSSVTSLLVTNLFTLVLAFWQHWSVASVLWTYWFQSVIIGIFQYKKIMDLKEFSTEGLSSNGRQVEASDVGKKMTARFFSIHYGFFHFVYMVFLFPLVLKTEWLSVIPGVIAFFFNHKRSYELHQDKAGDKPNLGRMMFFPYARILPMHLILIMGGVFIGQSQFILVVFILLKTGADVLMHTIEHRQR